MQSQIFLQGISRVLSSARTRLKSAARRFIGKKIFILRDEDWYHMWAIYNSCVLG